uniref:CRAL-TRIO domain-containing protein n=1 Tax=Palpitomonas bilix TaxID=652834 RepID=A0A7S3CV17_9EUKA|mmetsp:Transcript_1029/g.2142  ORF Transcript_1029/g.2142 Transcript_1029/m.2142 type:complete len:397 (+) Transcript_1029:27-1217(+)
MVNKWEPAWEGEEEVSIDELNEALKGTEGENVELRTRIRILVGAENNVKKATKIVAKYVEFRKKWNVDDMKPFPLPMPFIGYDVEQYKNESNTRPPNTPLEKRMQGVQRFAKAAIYKWDKEGRPVYYERTGHHNVKKLVRDCGEADCIISHLHGMEARKLAFEEASKRNGGKLYEKWTVVLDLAGLSFSSHMNVGGISLLKHLAQLDQDFYPQTMARLLVINTPKIFTGFWKIVKPFIDPLTLKKIKILGHDYHDTLFEFIEKENIPKEYGGTSEEELPAPPAKKGSDQYEEDGYELVKIANGTSHEVKKEGLKAGSIVSWQFKPKSYDVGFEVFVEKNGEKKSVVPYAKVGTGVFESGSCELEEAADVLLVFDNTYASWRSKQVLFSIDVFQPEE